MDFKQNILYMDVRHINELIVQEMSDMEIAKRVEILWKSMESLHQSWGYPPGVGIPMEWPCCCGHLLRSLRMS